MIGRQLAQWTASEGEPEDNPDPIARVRLEELLRVADLHVSDNTGLATSATGGLLSDKSWMETASCQLRAGFGPSGSMPYFAIASVTRRVGSN